MSVALNVTRTPYTRAKTAPWNVVEGRGQMPRSPPADAKFDALRKMGVTIRFERNETIFSEGDEAGYSYKVVSGAIRLCKHLANGRRQIASFFFPGDYCGFLQMKEHCFTAEAAADTVVLCYEQRQVERLCDENPEVRKQLIGMIGTKFADMRDHVVMLGRQTARARVASFLAYLVHRAGAAEGSTVELPMGRQDIADYLGLTIETVCRVLSQMKRSRLINLPTLYQFVVADMGRLHAVAEGEE